MLSSKPWNQCSIKKEGDTLCCLQKTMKNYCHDKEKKKKISESHAADNYHVFIAFGIITAKDRIMLKENGVAIELGRKWCDSIFKRFNFVSKIHNTKTNYCSRFISEIEKTFYKNEAVNTQKILAEIITNFHQMILPFDDRQIHNRGKR